MSDKTIKEGPRTAPWHGPVEKEAIRLIKIGWPPIRAEQKAERMIGERRRKAHADKSGERDKA